MPASSWLLSSVLCCARLCGMPARTYSQNILRIIHGARGEPKRQPESDGRTVSRIRRFRRARAHLPRLARNNEGARPRLTGSERSVAADSSRDAILLPTDLDL